MPKLTREEREFLRSSGIFAERPDSVCGDCGGYHLRACPRIKRQVWLGNGNRTEVEYWRDYDDSAVIYAEDLYDEEENGD